MDTAELDIPPHPIALRGAGAFLWHSVQNAIQHGVMPPREIVAVGRAGTGKSMGVIGATIALAGEYPNVPVRVLVIRLTRRSITTSSCVTIRKLLYPEHPMLAGPADDHRTGYNLSRWEWVLAGADNIDNLLSTEFDIIIPDETRQFTVKQWEELQRGLRNYAFFLHDREGNKVPEGQGLSKIPFGIIAGCTNPWTPNHWILQRGNPKQRTRKLLLINTTLADNPAYTTDDGALTLMGRTYDEHMRATMTGTRFRRLVLGEWCAAEGMIYEEWVDDLDRPDVSNTVRLKRENGVVLKSELKRLDVREFYCGVDFGDDAPGSIVLAGYTGDRKLIIIAEVYARKKTYDWWCDRVKELHALYPIKLGFCDHQEQMVTMFNDVIEVPREGPGAVFVKAKKGPGSVAKNIAIMRLRIARKTLLVDVDALVHEPQLDLVNASLPTCLVEEIPEYVHKREEDDDDKVSSAKAEDVPDPDCHDHSVNACQYLCAGIAHFVPDEAPPDTFTEDRFHKLMRMSRTPPRSRRADGTLRGEYRPEPDEYDETLESEDEFVARMIRESMNP